MNENNKMEWFERVDIIVSDPLRFKAKLAIGEDAYASLRVKNFVFGLWDAAGAASTAMAIMRMPIVTSKFFTSSGILATLGISTAATPIGWIVAAGVIAGGGWIGLTRYLKQSTDSKVTTIPNFINTPLDVLALGLFDLIAPLALKVASIDGHIDVSERDTINSYFVKQWGYDSDFVREGMAYIEERLENFSVKTLAQALGEFKIQNKDCNFKVMSREIVVFLSEIIEADGRIDEREEMAIEKVQSVFDEVGKFNLKKTIKSWIYTAYVFFIKIWIVMKIGWENVLKKRQFN